ncbi:transposase [Ralstonia pseudosolanacearum]|uniref:Transposase n=1 Tax=Ralstonia solanacearum TaxID=305 RepID=A0AA92EFT6_RALSL|nr:transposase [Ralstonia pseudosolanacearum]QCX50877.1 transposase [Ralstonia pseudosolanacearum]
MKLDEVRRQLPDFELRAAAVAQEMGDHQPCVMIYVEVLRYLVRHQAVGACHRFSAILYVLLAEFEAHLLADEAQEVSLRIGVVRSPDGAKFDHSWVQYGPVVYDAAVCLPNEEGSQTGGPVFASHDLLTGQFVHHLYTELAAEGLDDVAQRVVGWSLEDYASNIAQANIPTLWETIVEIGARIGFPLNADALRARYGATLRTHADAA